MDFPTLLGLPAHPLIVHATVVLVPLAALAVLLHAFVPSARARLGFVTPVLAGVALVLVPLSTQSGETLQELVPPSAEVSTHADLAEGLLPFVALLFVTAVLLVVRDRVRGQEATTVDPADATRANARRAMILATGPVVIGVLTVVAVLGTTVQVVRIGHSGAEASWGSTGSKG